MALSKCAGPRAVNHSRVHFTVSAWDPTAFTLSDEEFLEIQQPASRAGQPHIKKSPFRLVLQNGIDALCVQHISLK